MVAPSSAPILAMVARSGTDSVSTPGPAYSITRPTPPLTLRRRSTSKIISFADTMGGSEPSSQTQQTFGMST